MVGLNIVWSSKAATSLQQILLYYKTVTGNNKYSKRLYAMINDSLKLAARYPYMYRATTTTNTRVFICEYFKIYYSVHKDFIAVESVFDARQDPSKDIFQ